MGKCTFSAARAAELCSRLLKNETKASISRDMNVSTATIHRFAESLRTNGMDMPVPSERSVPNPHTAAILEKMENSDLSNRAISRHFDVRIGLVNKLRNKYETGLRANGIELAKCACGQDLHHPYFCWHRQRELLRAKGRAVLGALDGAVQDVARKMLLEGMTLRAVGERIGASRHAVNSFLRKFSPEERAQRRDQFNLASGRRRAAKMRAALKRPKSTDPRADPTYAAIARLVSRRIDDALRDDIISEAYVEFIHGRIKPNALREGVKDVQRRVFAAFANPWGDLSLDVSPLGDAGSTWADRLVDERALNAFEAVG